MSTRQSMYACSSLTIAPTSKLLRAFFIRQVIPQTHYKPWDAGTIDGGHGNSHFGGLNLLI